MRTRTIKEYARVEVTSAAALRDWLQVNHAQREPVWLVTAKKAAGAGYIPYDAIVEAALCFGWVDSLPRALDEKRSMLLLSPRKAGSGWSKPNRERVARLIERGRMQPPGLAKIEAAKADGSWDLLKSAEAGEVPDDLAQALAAAGAREGWDALSDAVRRRCLEQIMRAKRPETRDKRIETIVAGARKGVDPLAWRPKRDA